MAFKRSGFVLLLCPLLAMLNVPASAMELHSFVSGSMPEIVAAHAARPFILSFWSTSCTHCRDELTLLGKLKRQHPALDIVLVSTDTPEEKAAIQAALAEFALTQVDNWVYADSFADRLRFEVDKKWHGELPRTYFFVPGEARKAYSGKLNAAEVTHWVESHVSRP